MKLEIAPNLSSIRELCEIGLLFKKKLGLAKLPPGTTLTSFYHQFAAQTPSLLVSTLTGEVAHEQMVGEVFQIYSLMAWIDDGMPVFDLTHSLTSALLLTDPSDVLTSDFEMPFGAFIIRFPPGFLSVTNHLNPGEQKDAAYGMVHHARVERDGEVASRLILRVVGRANQALDHTVVWELLKPIKDFETIGDWIDTELPTASHLTEESRAAVKVDRTMLYAFRRLFVNACLYIAAHGRGVQQNPPRPKSKKKKDKAPCQPTPDIWILGKEVKLDSELMAAAKSWSRAQQNDRAEWSLRSKYTVRGHWRNQPHGPQRSLRRRQWIAPYWKGEGTAQIAHLYTTKEPTP